MFMRSKFSLFLREKIVEKNIKVIFIKLYKLKICTLWKFIIFLLWDTRSASLARIKFQGR